MPSLVKLCFIAITTFFALVWSVVPAVSSTNSDLINKHNLIIHGNEDTLQEATDRRLAMYNKLYPEIFFVQLAGGSELIESLQILQLLLGHEADNLDYEHPPELREDLLFVNLETIIIMLEQNASSGTLFRTGLNSTAERDYLCVITLTPETTAKDDATATQDLMLDVSEMEFSGVDPGRYLNHRDYLRFVIDHEAFHCLDSMYNGPRPMSKHDYWGEYMAFHHHQGADAFAIGMHIREHGGATEFIKKIGFLRALSVFYGDPNHYSYPIIQKLLDSNSSIKAGLTVYELFEESSVLRDASVLDYEAYLQFLSTAYETMRRFGRLSEMYPAYTGVYKPDEKSVLDLLSIVRASYQEIFNVDPMPE
jgi:hypothetical protein